MNAATILAWLNGRKSYLGTIAMGILGILWTEGVVSDSTAKAIGMLIATLTGIAFRHAIKKAEKPVVLELKNGQRN